MNTKSKLLGMSFSTARGQLIKLLLFKYICKAGENICFRCKEPITDVNDLTIDHEEFWSVAKSPSQEFFNTDKISFSHYSCNSSFKSTNGVKHPSHRAYNQGCRCDGCKEVERLRRQKQRAK